MRSIDGVLGSKFHISLLSLLLVLAISPAANAADEIWPLLKQPGYIVLLRHSNAPGSQAESNDMDFKDCSIQRNLDAEGRGQAARIGDAFRKHGITQAKMIASRYCRAIETAKLMKLGPVTEQPVLNLVHIGNPLAMVQAAKETTQFMKTLPAKQPTVLVTHVGNILAIAGANLSSGEMAIVHFDTSGELVLDAKILVP